ncbi:SDR family NAD(P)-dependent oxidoreductase [Allosphingosinicella deserti]|uniref:Daunorubicin C-13 ketoreductase n=1 Tax=Allosphingosinicella deserti TaxID=2116704 RepID=A0A2P7QIC3_9SPHN|nr:SDR family NAD(P)-dependent oxidoreductase [Sphingomonas deserti]PSJ37690.1 daunorubicin C-13 ketoreductase [Sphingomonas deserti]
MARIFITGSADGLGRAAAQTLIADGHDVFLHARSRQRAADLGDLGERAAGVAVGDLASAAETREIAEQVNALGPMDAIIHNAGIYTEPVRGSTPEGHATTLAVNSLAPYLLTALIARPHRLIYLSSGLHHGGEGSLDDLDWTRRRWDAAQAYAESKLHVAALAAALARRWPDVMSNAVDPGWVRTRMGGAAAPVDLDTGQRTQTWLATSNDPAALVSGGYWHAMRRAEPAGEVKDAAFQDALLQALETLTGVAIPQAG